MWAWCHFLVHVFLPICSLLLVFGGGSQGLGLRSQLSTSLSPQALVQLIPDLAWSLFWGSYQILAGSIGASRCEWSQGWEKAGLRERLFYRRQIAPFLLHHSLRSCEDPLLQTHLCLPAQPYPQSPHYFFNLISYLSPHTFLIFLQHPGPAHPRAFALATFYARMLFPQISEWFTFSTNLKSLPIISSQGYAFLDTVFKIVPFPIPSYLPQLYFSISLIPTRYGVQLTYLYYLLFLKAGMFVCFIHCYIPRT